MHKKHKFDQPRQRRRMAALQRFPLENVKRVAKNMAKGGNDGEARGAAYLKRRTEEYENLKARAAGSRATAGVSDGKPV